MDEIIKNLFQKYPYCAVCLVGIYKGKKKYFWEWNCDHGFNFIEPKAIIVNPRYKLEEWDFQTDPRMQLTKIMMNYPVISYWVPKVEAEFPYITESYESRMEYLDFIKSTKILEPINVYPSREMCVVGWMGHEAGRLSDSFEKFGWNVFRVAADLPLLSPWEYKKDITILENLFSTDSKSYSAISKSIVKYQIPFPQSKLFDHTLIIHNELALDMENLKSKYRHYYAHEPLWPRLPFNYKIDILFEAYLGAFNQLWNAHRYNMNQLKLKMIIPYAWSPTQYPFDPKVKRDIFFGFMGTCGSKPSKYKTEEEDYVKRNIRRDRAEYLDYAMKFCGLTFQPKGTDEEYGKFMNRCSLFFNISANFGVFNQRMFHSIGSGCVLVQNYKQSLVNFGFRSALKLSDEGRQYIDYDPSGNCLLFESKNQLKIILKWAHENPELVEIIRLNGFKFIKDHTYDKRAEEMIQIMLKFEGK